jgi:hypothetical protein
MTMLRNFPIAGLIVALASIQAPLAFGHAMISATGGIPPRETNSGIKTGPCGSTPRNPNAATTLTAGATTSLQIIETINHPGYYRLAYGCTASPTGTPTQATFDANVILPKIPDSDTGPTPHTYNVNFKVPDVDCPNGTLQMIQYMTENTPPSLYFSCADVKIVKTVTPSPTPTPTPTATVPGPPAPNPTSDPNCP